MIRTFLFDLGNVLVYFSHERMYRQIAAHCGRDWPDIEQALRADSLRDDYERGRFDAAELQRRLETRLATAFDADALRVAVGDIFEVNTPMLPILDELRRRGHRLVLLSNTNATHLDWIRAKFDIVQRFDKLVLSFEVGAIKPEKAIFDAALGAIDCPPDECFFTDDIPAYVEQARALGLQAEVFTGADEFVRHVATRGIVL